MKNVNSTIHWKVIGHQDQLALLDCFIRSEKRPHGYIFYGKPGLGKESIALKFIQRIMCFTHDHGVLPNEYPCGTCVHCQQTIHPDLIEIDREIDEKSGHEKKNISIEQVRHLQTQLQKGRFLDGYNCGLIKNAHTLSNGAANSLLKILEEPPQKTLIILVADDLHALPQTIRSRCQLIHFSTVPTQVIRQHLETAGVPAGQAAQIAALSNGAPMIADRFVAQPDLYSAYRESLTLIVDCMNKSRYERFSLLNAALQKYKGTTAQILFLQNLFDQWLLVIRDVLLQKQDLSDFMCHTIILEQLDSIGKRFSYEQLNNFINHIKLVKQTLARQANPQLAAENLLLSF